jgi:hypothetical protein
MIGNKNSGGKDFGYPFAIKRTNAYLTPKEAKRQRITDPPAMLKNAKHTDWEAALNNMLGKRGFVNDDEYNLWKKGGYK